MSYNRQILTDLQQKVNYLQGNLNSQRSVGTGQQQQPTVSNIDGTTLNEVRELARMIKSEINTLLQRSVRKNLNYLVLRIRFYFSSRIRQNVRP